MQGFEPVTLTWKGEDYTVPARDQLMLIARIEDALTQGTQDQAIAVLFREGGPPHSRLARAYGAALRHAGAKVSDDEIYLSIQADIAQMSATQVVVTTTAMLMGIIAILSPPSYAALTGKAQASEAAPDPKA